MPPPRRLSCLSIFTAIILPIAATGMTDDSVSVLIGPVVNSRQMERLSLADCNPFDPLYRQTGTQRSGTDGGGASNMTAYGMSATEPRVSAR